jgi:hypothetical protein
LQVANVQVIQSANNAAKMPQLTHLHIFVLPTLHRKIGIATFNYNQMQQSLTYPSLTGGILLL